MKQIRTLQEYKAYLAAVRESGKTIGFVPTMGFLHKGHLSLVEQAKKDNDVVVMSIFVNPLQFGPNEDFERYPRDEARDTQLAASAGVDVLFLPSVEEMYPTPIRTLVKVEGVTDRLCGASRPGHFDGVATVVMKLFHIIQPQRAYFGWKDAQQVAVIEQMVRDLNVPVQVVPCATLREPEGLAMSSRNVYLSPEHREQSVVLHRSLQRIEEWLADPGLTADALEHLLAQSIRTAKDADIDYVQVLKYPSLEPIEGPLSAAGTFIAAAAVRFGQTRLIDNRLFDGVAGPDPKTSNETEVGVCSAP